VKWKHSWLFFYPFQTKVRLGSWNGPRFDPTLQLRIYRSAVLFCGTAAYFGPRPPHFEVSRSQKIRHTHTSGRTPLNGRSASCRDRYLRSAQQTHGTNICALSGIGTHDPNSQAAADLRLRLHGLRNRPLGWYSAWTPNLRFSRGFTLSVQEKVEIVPWNRL